MPPKESANQSPVIGTHQTSGDPYFLPGFAEFAEGGDSLPASRVQPSKEADNKEVSERRASTSTPTAPHKSPEGSRALARRNSLPASRVQPSKEADNKEVSERRASTSKLTKIYNRRAVENNAGLNEFKNFKLNHLESPEEKGSPVPATPPQIPPQTPGKTPQPSPNRQPPSPSSQQQSTGGNNDHPNVHSVSVTSVNSTDTASFFTEDDDNNFTEKDPQTPGKTPQPSPNSQPPFPGGDNDHLNVPSPSVTQSSDSGSDFSTDDSLDSQTTGKTPRSPSNNHLVVPLPFSDSTVSHSTVQGSRTPQETPSKTPQPSDPDYLDVSSASNTPNTSSGSRPLSPPIPTSPIPNRTNTTGASRSSANSTTNPPTRMDSTTEKALQQSFSQVAEELLSQNPNRHSDGDWYRARDNFLAGLFRGVQRGCSDSSQDAVAFVQGIIDDPDGLREVANEFKGLEGKVVHSHHVDFRFGEKLQLVEQIKRNLSNILARENNEKRQKVLSRDTSRLSEEDKIEVHQLQNTIKDKVQLIKQVFEWIQREGTSEGSRLALNESTTAEEFQKLLGLYREEEEISQANVSSNGDSCLRITEDPPSDEDSLNALSTQDQKQSLDESITDCNLSLEGFGQSNEKSQLIDEIDALNQSLDSCFSKVNDFLNNSGSVADGSGYLLTPNQSPAPGGQSPMNTPGLSPVSGGPGQKQQSNKASDINNVQPRNLTDELRRSAPASRSRSASAPAAGRAVKREQNALASRSRSRSGLGLGSNRAQTPDANSVTGGNHSEQNPANNLVPVSPADSAGKHSAAEREVKQEQNAQAADQKHADPALAQVLAAGLVSNLGSNSNPAAEKKKESDSALALASAAVTALDPAAAGKRSEQNPVAETKQELALGADAANNLVPVEEEAPALGLDLAQAPDEKHSAEDLDANSVTGGNHSEQNPANNLVPVEEEAAGSNSAARRRPRSVPDSASDQKHSKQKNQDPAAAAKKPCKRKTGCGIILVFILIAALVAWWLSTRNKNSKASLQLDVSEIDHWDNEDTLMRTFHLNFSAFNLMGVLEILTNESNTTLTPGNASQVITVPCSLGEADLPPNAVTIIDSQGEAVLPNQWGPFNCQVPLNATVGLSATRLEFLDSIAWLFTPSIDRHFPVGEVALSLNGRHATATPGRGFPNITLQCRSDDKYLPEGFEANFYRQESDSFSTPVAITRKNWVQNHLSCVPTPTPPVAVYLSKVSREDTSTYPLWHFNANLNATAGTDTFVCLTFNHETVILNDSVPQKALDVLCEQGTGDLEENIAAYRSSASDCSIEGEAVPVIPNWAEDTLSCVPTPVNPSATAEIQEDLTMNPRLYVKTSADGWVDPNAQIGVKWSSKIFQDPTVEFTTTWNIATGGVLIHGGQCGAQGGASSTVAVTLNGGEIPANPSSLSFTCQDQPAELDCHMVNSPSMNPGVFCVGTGGAGVDGADKVVTQLSSDCFVTNPVENSFTWADALGGISVNGQCGVLAICPFKFNAQLNGQDLPVDLPTTNFDCSNQQAFFAPNINKAEISAAPMGAEPTIMPLMLLAAAKLMGRWLGGREEVGQVPAPR